MDGLAGSHKAIAQVRVLVELEVTTAEVEIILVVTLSKLLGHSTVSGALESGLENDLSRTTTKIKDSGSLALIGTANLAEKVVGGDPSINTFERTVHDNDTLVLLVDDREGVILLEVSSDFSKNSIGSFLANHSKTSGGLDGDGSAALEGVGNGIHSDLHEGIETLGSGHRVAVILAEATDILLGHLELLVLKLRGIATVVELVDVDSRTSAAGIDHENVLDNGLVLGVRLCASFGTVGRI
jgi:hypothetical protein